MIDRAWFEEKIAASVHQNARTLAPKILDYRGKPLDPTMLYKVFSGVRALTIAEAYQMAKLIDQSFEEVCLRALGKKLKR